MAPLGVPKFYFEVFGSSVHHRVWLLLRAAGFFSFFKAHCLREVVFGLQVAGEVSLTCFFHECLVMREVAILAVFAAVVLDKEFARGLRLLRLFLELWGSASGLARPGRVLLGVRVWAWSTVARPPIEVIAACFSLAFSGLGSASAFFAGRLAIGLSSVGSDSSRLEKIVVFDMHSVSGDDIDGFLQVVRVTRAFDLPDDFFVTRVLVETIDETAQ